MSRQKEHNTRLREINFESAQILAQAAQQLDSLNNIVPGEQHLTPDLCLVFQFREPVPVSTSQEVLSLCTCH